MLTVALHLHGWRRPALRADGRTRALCAGVATFVLSTDPALAHRTGLAPRPIAPPGLLIEMSAWRDDDKPRSIPKGRP